MTEFTKNLLFHLLGVLLPLYNASQEILDILFTLKHMCAGKGWGGKDGCSFMKTL